MQQQLVLLLLSLLFLQFSMLKSEIMISRLREVVLEFIYRSEQPPKLIEINVTTRPVSKTTAGTFYVISGQLIEKNIFIVDSITCRNSDDSSVQCSSKSDINHLFLDNHMLSDSHALKFNHVNFKKFLQTLTNQSVPSQTKYNLTYNILDISLDHIEKPREPNDFTSDTNLIGIIFLSICIVTVFLVGIGWTIVIYYRQYRQYRLKKKLREQLEKSTREVLKKSPIIIFDSTNPEYQCDDDEPTCAICLETFKTKEEIRKLVCSHYFHVACIDPWVLSRQSCPLCNRNILRHSIPSISSSLMDAINNESTSIANQTLPNRV